MQTQDFFLPTLKESPADCVRISHQLMVRAGLIKALGTGLYTWLPLGLRVLRQVERIVREEMNKVGGLEISMPAVQPATLWEESGRWQHYGKELLRIKDRHGRDFCFGPTHEEVVTDLVRHTLKSYKQLPLTLFQIQTKFRDEIRPRFGVMRAREFCMKDAYSFHTNSQCLEKTYQDMRMAYTNIFSRLGLSFKEVLADTGSIGGHVSHEFQVLAPAGEDRILYNAQGSYAANLEEAATLPPTDPRPTPNGKDKQCIATPHCKTVADVCAPQEWGFTPENMLKTLIVKGTNTPLVALILRGDHTLNPIKAEKLPDVASPLCFATHEEIHTTIGCGPGSLGPVDLPIPYYVDHAAGHLSDFGCGANQEGHHYQWVNWGRDVPEPQTVDLRFAQAGDPVPNGEAGTLTLTHGIEVGHVFQLGDKYTQAMHAEVLAQSGQKTPIIMGCYGIGVSRIVAAAIEQHHDQHGIIWPEPMAPFDVILIPITRTASPAVHRAVRAVYQTLTQKGYTVLEENRDARPGALFANADLIGIPHRVVVSEKSVANNQYEYKHRTDTTPRFLTLNALLTHLPAPATQR